MTLPQQTLAKLGIILASLLCFSLFLWFASTSLLLPVLSHLSLYSLYGLPALLVLLIPTAGGLLYLRFGRPENPRPLYIFIAIFLIAIALSFLPTVTALPVLFLLGTLSPLVLYPFLLSLPKTCAHLRTLKIISAIFSGIVLIIGLILPAYFTAIQAAAKGPTTGESPLFFGMMTCLMLITPVFGAVYMGIAVNSLKSSPSPQNSPQTDP